MSAQTKVTVYDLKNQPHRMTHLNARDMMQHNGWTLTPVDRAALAKAQAMAKADAEDLPPVDTSSLEKELNGKTKAEMIALAAERFDVKIDGRKGEAEVITLILEAAKKADSPPDTDAEDDDDGAAGEGGNE